MTPAVLATEPPWTDVLTAFGTVGTALIAVFALRITIRQAREDRAQYQADLLRQHRVRQLMDIVDEYVRSRVTAHEPGVERRLAVVKLRALLSLLPEGMARRLKHEFSVPLTKKDEAFLVGKYPGGIPRPIPEEDVYEELQSNLAWAIAGGDPAAVRRRKWPWHRHAASTGR